MANATFAENLELPQITDSDAQDWVAPRTDFGKVASLRHGAMPCFIEGTGFSRENVLCFSKKVKYDITMAGNTVKVKCRNADKEEEMTALECRVEKAKNSNNIMLETYSKDIELICEDESVQQSWLKAFESVRANDVSNYYQIEGVIGSGSFGSVYMGKSLETGEKVAIKTIEKKQTTRARVLCERELKTLRNLNHVNVVKTHDIFETKTMIYIVMELMQGGDLADVYNNALGEEAAKNITAQVLRAVAYLHGKGLVHRDIKPQNVLLSEGGSPGKAVVKIADFGLASFFKTSGSAGAEAIRLHSRVGTALFMAPEMLKVEAYDEKVDVWACGVLLHFMLFGSSPFLASSKSELFKNITHGTRERLPKGLHASKEAKDLINQLLQLEPTMRPTAAEARQHPWFSQE
mmetsp:Transcript_42364/g.165407  ORF Transcript_42364/g.165407 Transcript_42364/m.165407 type:complete len:406 (+) Transcript_42364:704-1921(+)|eukprot:CAMPEP_0113957922 /NCGR_PEP_ID=MMETSP0011_2-20120614/3049_1 /TAXON_ID=101924 /ORGANISM="Rhodosorus marinus" /LENGTH=405 /DNA_ID=CAMNT_0000968559 /DNA_START=114 /DNA_END=1331 /DNA_ORIENTATION=- /assembly_acc=CAM_ASM_000156